MGSGRPNDAVGHYLALYPGAVWWLDCPNDQEPSWLHVHQVLARIHRFGGWSSLTVLHHALAAWHLTEGQSPATRALAFLHDHHEAFAGDMPYPIKRMMGDAWEAVERPAQRDVLRWFPVQGADESVVKSIDVALTFAEVLYEEIAGWDCPWIQRAPCEIIDIIQAKQIGVEAVAHLRGAELLALADRVLDEIRTAGGALPACDEDTVDELTEDVPVAGTVLP